jgi:hypothetical protein
MFVIEQLNLKYKDVKNIIINGFKSAFISYSERVKMLNSALMEMEKLEEEEFSKPQDVDGNLKKI